MKNPLTPAGIETATFRFVAQHLNHCATAVPIIIIIWLNYTTAICINDNNNAVSNNKYERLRDISLFLKIPMGIRENFFEIYIQFGYAN